MSHPKPTDEAHEARAVALAATRRGEGAYHKKWAKKKHWLDLTIDRSAELPVDALSRDDSAPVELGEADPVAEAMAAIDAGAAVQPSNGLPHSLGLGCALIDGEIRYPGYERMPYGDCLWAIPADLVPEDVFPAPVEYGWLEGAPVWNFVITHLYVFDSAGAFLRTMPFSSPRRLMPDDELRVKVNRTTFAQRARLPVPFRERTTIDELSWRLKTADLRYTAFSEGYDRRVEEYNLNVRAIAPTFLGWCRRRWARVRAWWKAGQL